MSRESYGRTRPTFEVGFDPQQNCEDRTRLQFGEGDELGYLFDQESPQEEHETVSFESVTSD